MRIYFSSFVLLMRLCYGCRFNIPAPLPWCEVALRLSYFFCSCVDSLVRRLIRLCYISFAQHDTEIDDPTINILDNLNNKWNSIDFIKKISPSIGCERFKENVYVDTTFYIQFLCFDSLFSLFRKRAFLNDRCEKATIVVAISIYNQNSRLIQKEILPPRERFTWIQDANCKIYIDFYIASKLERRIAHFLMLQKVINLERNELVKWIGNNKKLILLSTVSKINVLIGFCL